MCDLKSNGIFIAADVLSYTLPCPDTFLTTGLVSNFRGSITKDRALSIQPKIPEISVGSSNGTDHFGLVRPEYSGPALKVVHCDRSGHFGR